MVQADSLFFAIPGKHYNGLEFAESAINRGAIAIVCERIIPHMGHIIQVQVKDVEQALSQIANRFYNQPDSKLNLIGITGTSGKTSTSYLLQHILSSGFEERTGLLGTIHYDLGARILPATRTTPDALSTSSYLSEMVQSQLPNAIMEVSSHGIAQKRVAALKFNSAIFTNLSLEHLDFHGDMENYFKTKQSFFFQEGLKNAIVNCDDPYGQRLLSSLPQQLKVVTFGTQSSAILQARNIQIELNGTSFDLVCPQGRWTVKTPLLGLFNVYNCLAALSVCYTQGYDLSKAIEGLKTFRGIPGRLEPIAGVKGFHVFVDYAHKPEALKSVLQTLRPLTRGKLNLVFGCGGDRDRSKRPVMVQIAEKYADAAWATSDNPRCEPQEQIFNDMKAGMAANSHVHFITDRAEAIFQAFSQCAEGDCLIIAGKGHERYQEISHQLFPFDDRTVIETCCQLKHGKA